MESILCKPSMTMYKAGGILASAKIPPAIIAPCPHGNLPSLQPVVSGYQILSDPLLNILFQIPVEELIIIQVVIACL